MGKDWILAALVALLGIAGAVVLWLGGVPVAQVFVTT